MSDERTELVLDAVYEIEVLAQALVKQQLVSPDFFTRGIAMRLTVLASVAMSALDGEEPLKEARFLLLGFQAGNTEGGAA